MQRDQVRRHPDQRRHHGQVIPLYAAAERDGCESGQSGRRPLDLAARFEAAMAEHQPLGAGGEDNSEFAEPVVDGYAGLFFVGFLWAWEGGVDDPLQGSGCLNVVGFAGAVEEWEEHGRERGEIGSLGLLELESADVGCEDGVLDYGAEEGGELVVGGGVVGDHGVEGADDVAGCVVVVEDGLGDGEHALGDKAEAG